MMITLGGDAKLELVDSLDPFSEGVVFSVRPLRRAGRTLLVTLSSLCLVFALRHYKPTPPYVIDEIDAALGMLLAHVTETVFVTAVMHTDGFEHLKASCLSVLSGLLDYVAKVNKHPVIVSRHGNDAILDGGDLNGRRVKQRL